MASGGGMGTGGGGEDSAGDEAGTAANETEINSPAKDWWQWFNFNEGAGFEVFVEGEWWLVCPPSSEPISSLLYFSASPSHRRSMREKLSFQKRC